jgi:PelA/Pel-15E family pectate lyase
MPTVLFLLTSVWYALPASVAPQPLTAERVAALPAAEREAWTEYLARSRQLREQDEAVVAGEREGAKTAITAGATPAADAGAEPSEKRPTLDLSKEPSWYASQGALGLADIVLSYQARCGGWSKAIDLRHRRAPGEPFGPESDGHWTATFDNGATVREIRFLARIAAALPAEAGFRYRLGARRGLDYILAAQYPNGGWPQVFPLTGAYHDGITYNDGAMANVLGLLADMTGGEQGFEFLASDERERAGPALARGLRCVLATQVRVEGRRTGWAQQYDPITLQPAWGRAFEMIALASAETAGVARLLMEQTEPDAEMVEAIDAAARWLESSALDRAGADRWARFYEIGGGRPLFGDRDQTVHYDVAEISKERREGYAWFVSTPRTALDRYARWKAEHPAR